MDIGTKLSATEGSATAMPDTADVMDTAGVRTPTNDSYNE
jgi:hypothetical protein